MLRVDSPADEQVEVAVAVVVGGPDAGGTHFGVGQRTNSQAEITLAIVEVQPILIAGVARVLLVATAGDVEIVVAVPIRVEQQHANVLRLLLYALTAG